MTVDATVVGTLRVHADDPSAAARELGRVSLRPESMPAHAVLIVRHMDDPLPGVLGTAASPTWGRAARSGLGARLRDAARPSAGPVPAGAIAVLFEDRAQLLAELAADWVADSVGNRWWWREFVRSRTATQAVVEAWVRDPRAAPAGLGVLARRGIAVAFARALPVPAARSLTAAVLYAWGAPETAAAAVHQMTDDAGRADGGSASPDPWTDWTAEAADEGLSTAARLLLGVGLSLARAPEMAARTAFWASTLAWLKARTDAAQPEGRTPSGHHREPATRLAVTRRAASADAAGGVPELVEGRQAALGVRAEDALGPTLQPTKPTSPSPSSEQAREPADGHPARPPPGIAAGLPASRPAVTVPRPYPPDGLAVRAGRPTGPGGRAASHGTGPPSVVPGYDVTGLRRDVVPEPRPAVDAIPGPPVAAGRVDTAFAGVFFLLNVALGAGLYGDFTRPATPGIPLSPWHLLALLGEQLLYPGAKWARGDDEDPVWALLAWLAESSESAAANRRRPPVAPRATRRWVRRLAQRFRPELSLALGCVPDAVGDVLLRHPGRVEATATHVDVVLSLADLPIAVRLAGLDRDPGWIPAAGRTVAFHFD